MRFRGIRYGRAARFQAPVAEPRATAPVSALAWGQTCPQGGRGYRGDDEAPVGEDCLVLNI